MHKRAHCHVFNRSAMNIFGTVKHGYTMDDHGNFETFIRSFVTLVRMSTGESWNGIMRDCQVQPPFCEAGVNCGSWLFSQLFFVFFIILSSFLFISVVAAVVMQQVRCTR